MKSIFQQTQMEETVIFNQQLFPGKIMLLACVGIATFMIFVSPAWGFDSTFPNNTTYLIHGFESGFDGGPGGGPGEWGASDELSVFKETITFMDDGTFTSNSDFDASLTRLIGEDGLGNTFTTTYEEYFDNGSGTYTISPEGVLTLTFPGDPDPEVIPVVLSENSQIITFGEGEYDDTNKYAYFGFGIGIKQGSGFPSAFPENTTFLIHEFESGFYGGAPGAWGDTDQLCVIQETITFMTDGTFTGSHTIDDSLTRTIGEDGGGNTFTTDYVQEPPGDDSGTYLVADDGTVTLTFTGPDPDVIQGFLSENGQVVAFGYGEYEDENQYGSFGFGVGIKQGSGFPPTFPDNTTYLVQEFESGFHGGLLGESPGAWGSSDQLSVIQETFIFMADGTFTGNFSIDDSLTRTIDDDGSGGNTFTTTIVQDSGSDSGTYTVADDGTVSLTFTGPDPEEISVGLSENGQVITFGYSEYENENQYGSFGVGIGIKRPDEENTATQQSILAAIFLLLDG